MSYIEFKNINKYFGDNHVLKGINLSIEQGDLVTLLGPSGCGKSTLLRCFSGLETVSDGEIWLDGTNITDFTPKQRKIGMVFQQYSLFPNMTVKQNVAFGLQMLKKDKKYIEEKVKETLEIVGLSEKINQYPKQLSGGQQQRVALARAIVMEPRVLLLDEPLSAIDALLRRNLQIEIRRIQQELKITTIFVTHDQEEAMVMSDMIHLFNMGRIEQSGSPEQIYAHPQTTFAANFIGHYNIWKTEDLKRVVSVDLDCENVAVRPEAIHISKEPEKVNDGYLQFKGRVTGSMSRGTTIVYSLDCQGLEVNADKLFSVEGRIAAGTDVYLTVAKSDVLALR
ncbi:MAG: ABC transporter ATP-binding protein [Coprococcus sp.]